VKKQLPFLCPDESYIEKMLRSTKAIVILARDNNTIIGVAGGWWEGTPSGYEVEDKILKQHGVYHEAHLDWLAVREEYREKGIGTKLVQKVCDWAGERGKSRIWVEVSLEKEVFDKVVFYNRLGFKEIGRFRDEKGEEYVTMLKRL